MEYWAWQVGSAREGTEAICMRNFPRGKLPQVFDDELPDGSNGILMKAWHLQIVGIVANDRQ